MSLESANLSPKICWQVSYPMVPRLFRELALEKKDEKALLETGTEASWKGRMASPPATALGPPHPLSLLLPFFTRELATSSSLLQNDWPTFHGCWAEQARARVCLLCWSPSGTAWPRWQTLAGGKQEWTRESTPCWQWFHQWAHTAFACMRFWHEEIILLVCHFYKHWNIWGRRRC